MNVFSSAANGLSLTPGQRAFLKVVKGLVVSAIGAGLTAGAQLLATGAVTNWGHVAAVAGVAFGTSLAFALDKYWTAQGDAPLSIALAGIAGDVGQMIETKAGATDTVLPFTAPATPAPSAS